MNRATSAAVALPTSPPAATTVTVAGADLDDLTLMLSGVISPRRYLTRGEADAAAAEGVLPDGSPCALPLRLAVPVHQTPHDVSPLPGHQVELLDPQGTPLAVLHVNDVDDEDGVVHLAGEVEPLRSPGRRPLQRMYVMPGELPREPWLAAVVDRPPTSREVDSVRAAAGRAGVPLGWLALTGDRSPRVPAEMLLQALLRTAAPDERVIAVPLAAHDELGAQARRALETSVASAYQASLVALLTSASRTGRPATRGSRVVDVVLDDGLETVLAALDGSGPPPALLPPGALQVLTAARRPPGTRGGVVLLSGLSGSGKSTVAQALRDELLEEGRTVSLLDGDEVRHLLSKGLGFSREDRDLNVRRIGFVAAEVSRHGGIAVAAPIAPYASSRADVRRRAESVGEFVLVHVATPLAECERRDRKGLYAAARAGLLPGFTGVSDPYEAPEDADVVVDTSDCTPEESAGAVMAVLRRRGWTGHAAGAERGASWS